MTKLLRSVGSAVAIWVAALAPAFVSGGASAAHGFYDFTYAVFMPVSEEVALDSPGNAEQIRGELRALKDLHINVVAQAFHPDSTEDDWDFFLDIAADEGVEVIPTFNIKDGRVLIPRWTGDGFDLGRTGDLIRATKDHSALYGIGLIDEPFHRKHNWEITAERMQMLYAQAKEIAPAVPMLVGWSREIWKADWGEYGAEYYFDDGMCDICMISALEFRNYGDGNAYYEETLYDNHETSRRLIRERDPDAIIVSTVQVFGSSSSTYYMPSAGELQMMIDDLLSPELQAAGELDGLAYQLWHRIHLDQEAATSNLADPEFAEHREIVAETWERVVEPDDGCTIKGTSGPETLEGTDSADVICGYGGDDTIKASRGADELRGGQGSDVLRGGRGKDVVKAGEGGDKLRGGRKADELRGGKGSDVLRGGRGKDVVKAGEGGDKLRGGRKADELRGEKGDDQLKGGRGADELLGGRGTDDCRGGRGDDSVNGC